MSDTTKYNAEAQVEDNIQNRGLDTKFDENDQSSFRITLMSIDQTIINHLKTRVVPSVVENGVIKHVPIHYGTPERWATVRGNVETRESNTAKLQAPLIMIRRTQVSRGALANPSNKYLQYTWETAWNSRNGYDQFAALNNIVPSREFRTIIIPDYVDLTYEVLLWTDYEEQMSDLIGQLTVENDEFWGERHGFKFRIKIDEFTSQSDLDSSQDRIIRSEFSMKVGAYLVPDRILRNMRMDSAIRKVYSAKRQVIVTEVDTTGNFNS
jgi:hypothetical protein